MNPRGQNMFSTFLTHFAITSQYNSQPIELHIIVIIMGEMQYNRYLHEILGPDFRRAE